MRRAGRTAAALVLAAAVALPGTARAESDAPEEADALVVEESPEAPDWSLISGDGDIKLAFHALLQVDGRFLVGSHFPPASSFMVDTFLIRRARPIIVGDLYNRVYFCLVPDFAEGKTVLYDAFFEVRLTRHFNVRAGEFKAPVGLERLVPAADLKFVERGLPTALAPNRDVGVMVYGEFGPSVLTYAFGVMNGVPDGASGTVDSDTSKDIVWRVFVQPIGRRKPGPLGAVGFGVTGSVGKAFGSSTAPSLAFYGTPNQPGFFGYLAQDRSGYPIVANGTRARVSPQMTYSNGPFAMFADYVHSSQAISHGPASLVAPADGWEVAGSYVASGIGPNQPASNRERKPWGALELTGRYTTLHVGDRVFAVVADRRVSAQQASERTVGVTWYWKTALKFVTNYSEYHFVGGASVGNRPAERLIVQRLQMAF